MIGERMRELRLARGLSQDELGKRLGYNGRSVVCRMESGKLGVKGEMLSKIAEILDCSTRYLTGEISEPYHYGANVITEDELHAREAMLQDLQLFSRKQADPESVRKITSIARELPEEKRQVVITVMETML